MKKTRSTIYFQKRYCLLVHSLILNQKISVLTFSANSSEREVIDRSCTFNINQIVYINCVDVIQNGVTIPDSTPTLFFSTVSEKMVKKMDIASVKFDMGQEKILKPQSSVLFSKQLSEGKGVIQYKFINLKTRTLTPEEFQKNRAERSELQLEYSRDEHNVRIQELMRILHQKDDLIKNLQNKIEHLISQNRKKTQSKNEGRQNSKDKTISFNVKVNSVNDGVRRQNEKLLQELQQHLDRIEQLDRQNDNYAKQKEALEKEVSMLKKQNEKLQSESQVKHSKGRSVSYIQPSFLRNSSVNQDVLNNSNSDWADNSPNPARINVNEPSQRKNSILRRDKETLKSGSPQGLMQRGRQSNMTSSAYVPSAVNENNLKTSNYQQKDNPNNESEQMGSNSRIEDLQGREQVALNRRISIQQQDLKLNSIIFEKKEEIDILKLKLQAKTNEVKNIEKELQKAKILLKKKQFEIKQMKKQSRKNLTLGDGSSKDLIKNRAQFEQQLDKILLQNDKQKVTLQQQIQRLQKASQVQDKQLKRVKQQLLQKNQRLKNAQIKYNEIKKYTVSKESQFIEYRQKSQQYDLMNIKYKEIQGILKTTNAKYEIIEKENQKLTNLATSSNAKIKELIRQLQRLKKAERQFELAKNQNINYLRSIDDYEHRYNELKKYCIRIEASYNKYVTSKRSKGSQGKIQQSKEEKQMQQKFIDVTKKMSDCQIYYIKQQIQDLNENKNFISVYLQRKLREERENIENNKELSGEEKRSMIIEKEREFQKNMSDKLTEFKMKISKLQKSLEEVNSQLRESKDGVGLSEKLRLIEKKISMINQNEQSRMIQRRNMKQTLQHLGDQLKRASSSSYLNKNASKNQLLLSMINQNKQKASLLDEARERNVASQQRSMEENRKLNTQLIKQNGELKLKNQKLTIEFDKIERKGQEREKQLQQIFKKSQVQFKLSNDRLLEANEKLKAQIQNIKNHYNDSQAAVGKISQQAALLSHELQDKQIEVQQLEDKIATLEDRIEEYEKSEKMMRNEVDELKSHAEQNQMDLVALIEARSDNFAKIQKMKQIQIEKLKQIIFELEVKLQAEMFEGMKLKDKNQEILTNLEKLEKETQQKLEIQKLAIQSKQAAIDEIYLKQIYAKKQNEILQENLLEISTQIESKQIQIAQMAYQLTRLKKQAEIYKNEASSFEKLQQKYKDDIKGLQIILKQKLDQIRGFQDKYRQLQLRFDYAGKQMQRLALSSLRYETDAKEFQQKYMNKHEQVMQAKNECSLLQLQLHKQQIYHENQAKQNQLLKEHVQNIQREIQRLTELSNNNQNNLRVSRKVSSEVDNKNDISSIGKSRKIAIRRSGTLEVPQVSAIGGNITPINPVSPSPLIRKLSQNPFQPREESKQIKLIRGTSMQQPYDGGDIAIHIQSPTDSLRYHNNKNLSNIQIDIPDVEDNIRFSNNNVRPSSKQINQQNIQIREQTQENQENSGAFGRNIDLENSEEIVNNQNGEYEQHIYQLKQQLIRSNEENEELAARVEELSNKIQTMMADMAQNQPNTRGNNLSLSRKIPNMQLPISSSERDVQIRQSKKANDHRSSSGLQLNSSREKQGSLAANPGNYGQLQQQYQSAQLQIQYLTNELNAARSQLQQYEGNNERLIQQAELCREKIEELNNMVQQAHFQIAQAEKFMQFQRLYKDQIDVTNQLKIKIQELNTEIFSKQDHIATLIKQHGLIEQQLAQIKRESVQAGDSQAKLQNQIKHLQQTISKLKIEYRKYEQSAELQILHLKDSYDALKQKLEQKQQQVLQLGQQYLQLQSNRDQLVSIIEEKDKIIKKNEYSYNQLSLRCNDFEDQLGKTDDNRQNLYKTIKKLQQQIDKKDENLKKLTNQTALTIKKYQIKLESNQKQIELIQQKMLDKQKVISSLKSQIGLYNEECQQLKVLNDQLNYQSTKIQKQLKDIMITYSSEIDAYRETIASKDQEIVRLGTIAHQKESQYHHLLKNMRSIQKEKDNLNSDYIDVKNMLQKTKNAKLKENNQIFVQLQYKNSECEKLKAAINSLNKQIERKSQSHKSELQKYENRLLSYKQKLERYEKMTQQFQQQLKKVQQRPTVQAFEQVIFQNEIYRNRIQQLEEQMHSKGDSRIKEQLIYSEFRKYKANKQRQSQDLEAQMEKYGLKINQLEESNYFLKKENENLKTQIQNLRESNDQMNNQCEDMKQSMQELEKQLHFYKKRKIFDMQKLLNDTQ